MKTTTTTINCPVCGSTMEISINTINNKSMKAQERIEALRKAGVNVDNLFTLSGANGGEYIAENKNGQLTILTDDDPIFQKIMNNGAIPNRKLFRRWVMAQMFRNLTYKRYDGRETGITAAIKAHGYKYQWDMTIRELHAIVKMARNKDVENFYDRTMWFNADVCVAMAHDYLKKVTERFASLPVRTYQGKTYRCIGGKMVCDRDFYGNYLVKMENIAKEMSLAADYMTLESLMVRFDLMRYKLPSNTAQCPAWMDAYKGSGAFFTMQNMIRFHNCKFIDAYGEYMSKNDSYQCLKQIAKQYGNGKDGWRMVGVLKQFLDDNNIVIEKMMASWRK